MSDEGKDNWFYAAIGIVMLPFMALWLLVEGIVNLILAIRFTPARQEADARTLTTNLYDNAVELAPKKREFAEAIYEKIAHFNDDLCDECVGAAIAIWDQEDFDVPPPPAVANSIEGARYRDMLSKRPDPKKGVSILVESFRDLDQFIPEKKEGITFPMTLRDVATPAMIEAVVFPLYKDDNLFRVTKKQLDRQLHRISNVPFDAEHMYSDKLVMPSKYKGTEHITQYLYGTPLYEIFDMPVPFSIPPERLFEHVHILGGSGAGKTELLKHMLLYHLNTDASIVVVDSQTDLIRTISHLDLPRDPIIISPRDLPSFNIFDVPDRGGDKYMKEQIANGVIETYMYFFDGIIGADLTTKQGVFFQMVARLLLNLKDTIGRPATILDMFRLMEDTTPYLPAINKLDEIPKAFFLKDFQQSTFKQTREQIRYRLNAILVNPTIAKLFTASHNSLDFYELLQGGNVLLIDTSKDFLKDASPNFGRFFISLVLRAIYERAATTYRHPTFLFIDEAAEVFDSNIDEMLTQMRKYRCGAVMAHQFLDQATSQLRSSLAANTSVKMVSGVSNTDARNMAPDMRTTHDFIMQQPKLSFACHVRGMKNAVSVQITPGLMDEQPKRSDYNSFIERNRERVTIPEPEYIEEEPEIAVVTDEPAISHVKPPQPMTKGKPKTKHEVPPDDPLSPVTDW